VFSISISLIAVFIPILLMGGIVGRLFREFAMTLSAAILISLVVSLVTTPMLCATLLGKRTEAGHGRLYRMSEGFFDGIHGFYSRTLTWVLRHPHAMLGVTISVAVNVYLFVVVPKGFFPPTDTVGSPASCRPRRTSRSRQCATSWDRSSTSSRAIRRSRT
jgi:multidrug efflux pump